MKGKSKKHPNTITRRSVFVKMTFAEEVEYLCLQHLPPHRPKDAVTGGPVCGLLDILRLTRMKMGVKMNLPYTLKEGG